jgi:hypothetical protein
MAERGRWAERVDALLLVIGVAAALAGVYEGVRHGRSLLGMLRGTWIYSSGVLFVAAAVVAVVIVLRWRASREEAELLRKYPPRTTRGDSTK